MGIARKKSLRSRIATAIFTAILLGAGGAAFAPPASAQLGNSATSPALSMTTHNLTASTPAPETGRKEKSATAEQAGRDSPGWPITVLAWLFVVAAAVVSYYQFTHPEL